jgi:hypothetical protein
MRVYVCLYFGSARFFPSFDEIQHSSSEDVTPLILHDHVWNTIKSAPSRLSNLSLNICYYHFSNFNVHSFHIAYPTTSCIQFFYHYITLDGTNTYSPAQQMTWNL